MSAPLITGLVIGVLLGGLIAWVAIVAREDR